MTITATAPPLNGEVTPRSLRTSPRKRAKSPTTTASTSSASASASPQPKLKKPRAQPVDESELDCAACPAPGQPAPTPGKAAASDRETWICCTQCKTWFHCICIGLENPDDYTKWYCEPCIARSQDAFASGTSSSRPPLANVACPPRRKSHRTKLEVDYAAIQEGIPADPLGRWKNFLNTYDFEPDRFPRMQGHEWTLDWLMHDDDAMRQPVLVPAPVKRSSISVKREDDANGNKKKGGARLAPTPTSIPGMVVPPSEMTIADIADIIGHDTPVEVIDVASQSSSKASWTISEWAEYFEMPRHKKKKTLNVISLEVTGTPLQAYVEAPQLVRDLDWVTRDWPSERRDASCADNSWPKVQRYVLMGVEGAYSDWHIDFAGSSVYYHVIWGQKTFLFAPPTPRNLAAYKAWCSSTRQDFDWLGDHLHGLTRVDIRPGETMLIPSGWLHCVYTPQNTLVVGGNFLTDWNVATQWKLVEIEDATKVPKKFRFPHLKRLSWYVASGWNQRLSGIDGDRHDKGQDIGQDGEAELTVAEAEALVDVVPPRKVLEGIGLVCQSLSDDLELIQDEYIGQSGDERAVKQQKAAREAIPTHHVGNLVKAEAMLAELNESLERAMRVADQVHAARQSLARQGGGRNVNKAGSPKKARR